MYGRRVYTGCLGRRPGVVTRRRSKSPVSTPCPAGAPRFGLLSSARPQLTRALRLVATISPLNLRAERRSAFPLLSAS
jgi:hypothetical protein